MLAARIGWLTDVTDWLRDQLATLWTALVALMQDMIVFMVEGFLSLISAIVNAIPVPDFLSETTICGLLSQAGPTAAWVMENFHIAEGMTLVTSALAFRMLRKLLTLFQW